MGELYFLRHGQTVDNAAGNFPDPNTQLTDLGRSQPWSTGTRDREDGFVPDIILSSDRIRAVETTAIYAVAVGYKGEIIYDSIFRERDYGDLTGKPEELYLPGDYYETESLDHVSGAETVAELVARSQEAHRVLERYQKKVAVLVGHNAFTRFISRNIHGLHATTRVRSFENGIRENLRTDRQLPTNDKPAS